MKRSILFSCLAIVSNTNSYCLDDPSKEYATKGEVELYYDLNRERYKILEDELSSIKSELEELKDNFWKSKIDVFDIKQAVLPNTVSFNLKEKGGFKQVNSSEGTFFVSVDEVKPYLDGYKVKFLIGNPYSISFKNPKIKITCNRSYGKYIQDCKAKGMTTPTLTEWASCGKEKEYSVMKELKSMTWNSIEIVLNATLDELETVWFSFESSGTISMFVDKE